MSTYWPASQDVDKIKEGKWHQMLRGLEPRKFDPFLAAQKIRKDKVRIHTPWMMSNLVGGTYVFVSDQVWCQGCTGYTQTRMPWFCADINHEWNIALSLTTAPISCGAVSRAFIWGGGHTHGFPVIFWPIWNLKAHSQNLSHPYPCCLLLVGNAGAPQKK